MASYAASLVPRIRTILESADLSSISAKGVRRRLVEGGEDGARVKAERAEIDERINEIYEELAAAADASSDDEKLASGSGGAGGVKGEGARAPAQLDADERLARALQADYDALLSARGRRAGAAVPKKAKKAAGQGKRKSRAVVGSDDEGAPPKKRGGGGAFNKELLLSEPLAQLVGEPRLSRPQTVKRIWEHVKANGLQDAADKRFILCDEPLRAVFKTDKLHMFTMNKILSQHLRDPEDVTA